MPKQSIHSLHPVEKPRERMKRNGPGVLKDEELLAILLRTGYKKKDVLSLSRELLKEQPGRQLFEKPFSELAKRKGIGPSRAATLLSAWELARRHSENPDHQPLIRTPEQVCAAVADIREKKKEHFVVLYLNTRHRLIRKECISVGTLNASLVHPREVFEPAVRVSAASLILAHNHPSGDPSPSQEDYDLTKKIMDAGHILGFDILDHVIVTLSGHHSMKEKNDI